DDDAAGLGRSRLGVQQAQGDSAPGAPARLRLLVETGEGVLVGRQRVGVSGGAQEAEAPGASAGGPQQAHRRPLSSTSSRSPCSQSILKRVRIAVSVGFFARSWAVTFLSFSPARLAASVTASLDRAVLRMVATTPTGPGSRSTFVPSIVSATAGAPTAAALPSSCSATFRGTSVVCAHRTCRSKGSTEAS